MIDHCVMILLMAKFHHKIGRVSIFRKFQMKERRNSELLFFIPSVLNGFLTSSTGYCSRSWIYGCIDHTKLSSDGENRSMQDHRNRKFRHLLMEIFVKEYLRSVGSGQFAVVTNNRRTET
uniref:Uncharacterized protein n=1 Tax=Onchocerca volvulus TaxID=6282 RepID=A0A8R1Y327_ONCVO